MYDLANLCKAIAMPEEVTRILLSDTADDSLGLCTLRTHLEAACAAWDRYRELGISEEIYIATMAAFSRFVREHRDSFGRYGFDRDFWTTRQTGCLLFRIGTLEYELLTENGSRFISLHIPSDADLSLRALRSSWAQAKQLLDTTFPDFRNVPWICHSWLLSPPASRTSPLRLPDSGLPAGLRHRRSRGRRRIQAVGLRPPGHSRPRSSGIHHPPAQSQSFPPGREHLPQWSWHPESGSFY